MAYQFKTTKARGQNGSLIVTILIVMFFLSTVILSLVSFANTNIYRSRSRVYTLQALYSAESGADIAIANLNNIGDSYSGTSTEKTLIEDTTYKATYNTAVITSGGQKIITSVGKVYIPASSTHASYTHSIEVIAEKTSTDSASSLVSRNIIDVQSGVKNISGKNIYVNGYINMNKNTTNLIAENITVGGKNTGASNCSIGGSGNLIKPAVFTTPGQTKTNITVAYNNCINPPGNTSNANFNVSANHNNIGLVQSTLIPVSQFMDSSYQNSPGGCSDWTSGSFPRNIPSTGNAKKTHYPNSSSGVSTACGSSGDLYLAEGQYNIKDNVHVRANLCAASACEPTFYNPDQGAAGIKYVFIEGNVNFSNLHTATGSGPIVFIVYGPDPASKTSVCPLGGAFYLGNDDRTSAPALYAVVQNGFCADKTKFDSSPALGGITGKNIYIATSPGTPFDLALDSNYPVTSIPINLSWKATLYRRI